MTLVGAVAARSFPPATLLAGVTLVVASIQLYSSKPKPKAA